jgi:N-hydroxyarylamine O-acetyltransferase
LPTVLDQDRLFDKVVRRRRGGICHELNALFFRLLLALGFDVVMLSGRVYGKDSLGPELEHMLLLVELERRWIADVGFGETFQEPLPLDDIGERRDGQRSFFLGHEAGQRVLWMRRPGKAWTPQYRFTLEPRSLDEYSAACEFRLTSPGSFFSKNLLCSLANASGRVTVLNDRLIVAWNGLRRERRLRDERNLRAALSEHFGIVLPDDPPIRIPGRRPPARRGVV